MKVHSVLGPGLLESAYQACLAHELRNRGFGVLTEVPLPVIYQGHKLELGYRIDLVVENRVVVEVKSVEAIHPIHEAQLLSYLLHAPERDSRRSADQFQCPLPPQWHKAHGGWARLAELIRFSCETLCSLW